MELSIKEKIGFVAAELVKEGMLVGLGTGSTSVCFIHALAKRCQKGLSILTIASSTASEELARSLGIPVKELKGSFYLDLTVDGADEIDPHKRLIKGAGGALLREKILAYSSKEMIVIADSSKLVHKLGIVKLPVEVVPFAHETTQKHLHELCHRATLRLKQDLTPYITDNNNYIYDLSINDTFFSPEELDSRLKKIPGIVETGLFIGIASKLIIGDSTGQVHITS